MTETCYICKYTPVELLEAYGGTCRILNEMPDDFARAEQFAHPNLCGFGKAVLEEVLSGHVHELILVSCCDTIRSVFDLLAADGRLDFLYMLDLMHCDSACSRERMAAQLRDLAAQYGAYRNTTFDRDKFVCAFHRRTANTQPHLAVLGARMGTPLFALTQSAFALPVENESCVGNRAPDFHVPDTDDFDALMLWYAGALLGQLPCMRMTDHTGRRALLQNPGLKGIIYHTVKFCDFYGFEYAQIKNQTTLPILKIESDYTLQSTGQLLTRLQAFAERIDQPNTAGERCGMNHKGYYAGIDSGSTSTDVVILNHRKELVASVILPTGSGAARGAERALELALRRAGIDRTALRSVVTTGYGRAALTLGNKSITEITCHARGAHFLDPSIRTVVDIGGQDSKAISLDEDGNVKNFAMNDKCAAGTGRFLELMARTMEMDLSEMSQIGLHHQEELTISSMCTVFAESEVVSLIAQNRRPEDIVHGLNKAVAAKTVSLVRRVGGGPPYMMTGGVAQNQGVVKTLEEQLNARLVISEHAQLCGALGAALFALDFGGE